VCRFPRLRLAPGQYSLGIVFADQVQGQHDGLARVCPFDVVMAGQASLDGRRGHDIVYVDDAEWTVSVTASRGNR
jgi:hypothetical protein